MGCQRDGRETREGQEEDVTAPAPSGPFLCRSPLQALAVRKGKRLEGSVREEASIWKTQILCALNKSVDFGTFESATNNITQVPTPLPLNSRWLSTM